VDQVQAAFDAGYDVVAGKRLIGLADPTSKAAIAVVAFELLPFLVDQQAASVLERSRLALGRINRRWLQGGLPQPAVNAEAKTNTNALRLSLTEEERERAEKLATTEGWIPPLLKDANKGRMGQMF